MDTVRIPSHISFDDLLERWRGKEIDGVILDRELIYEAGINGQLEMYYFIRFQFENGKKVSYGEEAYNTTFNRFTIKNEKGEYINYLFSLEPVKRFEKENFLLVHKPVANNTHDINELINNIHDLKLQIVLKDTELSNAENLIRDYQNQLKKISTVNATKWENSVKAAFGILTQILTGDKFDWTLADFTEELSKKYSDYHVRVKDMAWRAIPQKYKKGPGRPTK